MNLTDSHLPRVSPCCAFFCGSVLIGVWLLQHGSKYLDQAFLHFFEQFRMVYVGDVIQKTCGVSSYSLLSGIYMYFAAIGKCQVQPNRCAN